MQPTTWVFDTIKKFEGLSLKPYKCPAGTLTVGYGHTRRVDPTKTITVEDAENLLKEDVDVASAAVNHYVTNTITQPEFDALTDFCFNLGETNFKESTLLKLINNGKFAEASEEFEKWNHCAGKVLDGLTKRRQMEKQHFLTIKT